MNPQYPIYIISKGRAESRLTSKALERYGVPYHIVVEPQEYDEYAKYIDPSKIYTLPFSNLNKGSIPARNWCWDHAQSLGVKRYWLVDDNIRDFGRYNHNMINRVTSGTVLKLMEDWTDRYDNLAITGPQYDYFIVEKNHRYRPVAINQRVYSCSLILTDAPFRWRGRYNEDTDLCLRMMKAGWGTALFYAFIQYKQTTLTMKGGNTDNVYIDGDGRWKFAKALQLQHPNHTEIVERYGRWHHYVDYRAFINNDPKLKKDINVPKGVNNHGLILKRYEVQ